MPKTAEPQAGSAVAIVRHDSERKVDVLIDDRVFTSYEWPERQKKPVLFPLRTATGTVVTRGYPLEPRPGESHDHPHHAGLWFNYGNVDGVDFWNNSETRPQNENRFGTIVHRSIVAARGGRDRGELDVTSDWLGTEGQTVLHEQTQFIFAASPGRRAIDRVAVLSPAAGPVTFPDDKEGLFGLRVGKALEMPSKKNPDATGQYISSEGKVGDAVWGTRARWVMLTGKVDGEPVTIAILDHPKNPGFPAHWHARGYGLFAANPLGQKVMAPAEPPLAFSIPAGQSARFAYRVVILSRTALPAEIDAEHRRFLDEQN